MVSAVEKEEVSELPSKGNGRMHMAILQSLGSHVGDGVPRLGRVGLSGGDA